MRNIRDSVFFVAILALITFLAGQSTRAQPADAKRLIGTWRVVSVTQQDGQPDSRFGAHPSGLIYYDASGHMAVQIMRDSSLRHPFAGAQPTPEEAQAAVRDYVAYFGTYSVDERAHRITHHREGAIAPGPLADFVRQYEFLTGDRFALTIVDGNGNRLVFERVK